MAEQSEPLGAEASAALAETAAAVAEPSFTEALSAFVKEQGGGAATEIERGADAPAADTTETEGGDYDPEAHAEEPPKDEVETKPDATAPDGDAWPEDIKKTWDQYPTERERAKALAENKRYGIEQADKAKRLEAELAELRGKGTPAAATAPETQPAAAAPTTPQQPLNADPTADDVKAAIDRLSQQDPVVAQVVETLGTRRSELIQKRESRATLRTEIQTAESELAEVTANVKYLENRLKGRPDDFALQEELDELRVQRRKLATEIDSKHISAQRMDGEISAMDGSYRRDLSVLRDVGVNEHSRFRAQTESDRTFTDRKDKEAKTWTDSFSALAKDLKIPAALHESANKILLLQAAHHIGDIDDVATWMRENATLVTGMLEAHRSAVLTEYGDAKRADAAQPAPKGPAAVAPVRGERPLSSKEESARAEAAMRQVFSR